VQERGGPRPFDVATRGLIETDPVGWLSRLGLPIDGPVHAVDSEVSAVLAEVDKVLRVGGASPWLAHLELQVSHDPGLPRRLLQYHAILLHRHQIPVVTTVVLLRRQAQARELTGHFEQRGPAGELTVSFNYNVVNLWERPVDELLTGGLGVVPLAPLAAFEPARLPQILDDLNQRFEQEAPSAAADLWAATALLMGVRYDRGAIRGLMQRVRRMRESVTYQIILEEGELQGRIREARDLLIQLGAERLGPPDATTIATLDAIEDRAVLEGLIRGLFTANTWQALLAAGQS
jgi:predicted transposase YdaD